MILRSTHRYMKHRHNFELLRMFPCEHPPRDCTAVCVCVCVCVCVYVCIYVCVDACMYVCMHVYICMYIHIYTPHEHPPRD
jgi:hypothetical protein